MRIDGPRRWLSVSVASGVVALSVIGSAQERDRSKIPDRYKWDLSALYPDVGAWRSASQALADRLPSLEAFKGRLGESAAVLADALTTQSDLRKDLARQYAYANMLADQDTRDAAHQGMKQQMEQLDAAFDAATAFVEPEILRLPPGTIDRFLAAEPRLAPYRFYLEDVERRSAHTLSADEERLLAAVGPLAAAPSTTFTILSNADLPFPTVTLSDGRTVTIDQAAYADLRALPNRADREKVMSAFFTLLGRYRRTFGTTMNAEVQAVRLEATARKYPSDLAYALDAANIPTAVYSRLIEGVHRHLPELHRYLRLRQRMLGVDQLHYYDLYAPLVGSVKLEYTPEQAEQLVLDAVAPLGPDYQAVVRRAFNERWIDLLPAEGKVSGAYSDGAAYDVHPYMLINYNGKYTDVSTIAHEMGHTLQSYYSNTTQPYPLARYPIFVAEVASTFNEALLMDHVLAGVTDDDTRLELLGNYLENIKGTVFRQTQFAEFELAMHQMAEKGEPITGDALAKLYLDITKRYYGADQGICVVDDYVANEWSYIPHFYYDFYVYQYATSFTASLALADAVRTGGPATRDRYLRFISAGGSKYPIDLLKDAGVDMTTDQPLDATMAAMSHVMDEMEAILAKQGK
jgi:oligoendopeptidase F